MGEVNIREEWLKCTMSPHYFVHNYCYIYDAAVASWIPFHLWPGQADVLNTLKSNLLVVILKARQLGQTWLSLSFILWLALFQPSITGLLFSRRDEEAQYLLERLRGIYKLLPPWMKAKRLLVSNSHEWSLSNGSTVYAFPTTAGDSYTASIALVDEADLVPNLDFLMNAVKPTIDGGGRMILLSRSNKDEPQSTFKRIYRGAIAGTSPWKGVFLPWYSHPKRTPAWYDEQQRDVLARTTVLDDLWQQYPATDMEALIPRTLDKRLPAVWVTKCFTKMGVLETSSLHSINPKIRVYREPEMHHQYVIGADPAEGNPHSDPSAFTVLDTASGEEVCSFNERIEPTIFSAILIAIARTYNRASTLVERNNHGHVVIADFKRDAEDLILLAGQDGVAGWHTNAKSKSDAYSEAADFFRYGTTIVHSEDSYFQLCAIVGTTLRAPEGEFDDLATSYVLALKALTAPIATSFYFNYLDGELKMSRESGSADRRQKRLQNVYA